MSDHHHHHGGAHAHVGPDAGATRLTLAIAVNLGLTILQIVGGLVSGSLALVADAVHNLSDALSLIVALFARRIGRRPADATMTFGYQRAEVVAALINYTTLIVIGLYLAYEAVFRIFMPSPIEGWIVVWVAVAALVVDTVTALLVMRMARDSMNIRAAFLHNLADAAGSVAVIVAGIAVLVFDWVWADAAVTLLIAGYILWMAFSEIGPVIRILMLGSPVDLETGAILTALGDVDGISDVHHFHLWQMQEGQSAVDAHLVIAAGAWENADLIKGHARQMLITRYGIDHVTLEIECSRHACVNPATIGHGRAAH